MPSYDFDLQRYIARRKGLREAEAREGAAYAYSGDIKVLRTLDKLRPVTMAIEATVKLWRQSARAELLGTSIRASERQFPRVSALGQRAAEALHVAPPIVYVSAQAMPVPIYTFGTEDESAIVMHGALVDELSDQELLFAIGHECGHVQNGHVLFRTALYFLRHSASSFVRWIVTPAVAALDAWSRRADVTGDRAGLLCLRDVDLACIALTKVALGTSAAAPPPVDAEKPGEGDGAGAPQVGLREAEVARRVSALRAFGESAYFRGVVGQQGGYPPEACDERVAEILSKGA